MRPIVFQTLLLGTSLIFLIAVRRWVRGDSLRRTEEERERRAAVEREWRVGIPYDPPDP